MERAPNTINPYAYVMNDPVNAVDPDGNFVFLIPLFLEGVVVSEWLVTGVWAAAGVITGVLIAKRTEPTTSPQSEPNIKGQGRERIQKKRKNPNWEDRSNKPKDRPIRPKKHTPGREHRKYK